ncbi:MAG: tail fiber domain-containing protein [Flavobacterium sp.]
MKHNFQIALFIFICGSLTAQTGIGTTTPDASAKLEVSATNKGFLPPRVALTASNAASPITSPANGLMVFNTVTAGTSPNQVVPGYYYWDATGLKWVSLSTTVGNVQNQAIFRSSSNTAAGGVVTWASRFNNIASGDITVTSNQTFQLSNGIYKIEWALPYEQSNTYNLIQLQELQSSTWNAFLNDGGYANLGNGGNTDWGGGTFAADVVDCTSSTRNFRLVNMDGYRALYYGATFTITKLNPAITTSTTADNLGNHTATKNIQLNGNYISNDGGNEGIRIDNSGNVGIGSNAPTTSLYIENGNAIGAGNPASTTGPSLRINNTNSTSTTAHATALISTSGTGSGKPYLGLDINGNFGYSMGINNPTDQLILNTTWNFATGTAGNNAITINRSGQSRVVIPSDAGTLAASWPSGWGGGLITYDFACAGIYYTTMLARSDRRLKNTIVDLEPEVFSKYLQLRPVNFYWNDGSDNKHKQYGLIAQEVEELFPDMVSVANDSMQTKSVNFQALHALSLKVIQEQQKQIEALQQKQAALEKRLLLIESKLK